MKLLQAHHKNAPVSLRIPVESAPSGVVLASQWGRTGEEKQLGIRICVRKRADLSGQVCSVEHWQRV